MSRNQLKEHLDSALWIIANLIIWGSIGVMLAWRG